MKKSRYRVQEHGMKIDSSMEANQPPDGFGVRNAVLLALLPWLVELPKLQTQVQSFSISRRNHPIYPGSVFEQSIFGRTAQTVFSVSPPQRSKPQRSKIQSWQGSSRGLFWQRFCLEGTHDKTPQMDSIISYISVKVRDTKQSLNPRTVCQTQSQGLRGKGRPLSLGALAGSVDRALAGLTAVRAAPRAAESRETREGRGGAGGGAPGRER